MKCSRYTTKTYSEFFFFNIIHIYLKIMFFVILDQTYYFGARVNLKNQKT